MKSLTDQDSLPLPMIELVRSAVRDPKAPCSELRQQCQNLINVQASTRTVNRLLNKAILKACRPRHRTFLTLDHLRNRVQWAANKLHWSLSMWRHNFWSERAVFCCALRMGWFAYGVDRIHFKITSLGKLKCSVADPLWYGAALVMTTILISRLLNFDRAMLY